MSLTGLAPLHLPSATDILAVKQQAKSVNNLCERHLMVTVLQSDLWQDVPKQF